jgi:group I intron endonuclease
MEEGFVYKWIDSSNGMMYIGSHKGSVDDGYIGSGIHFNRAYKKRPDSFNREIIYVGKDFRELEEFILEEYDAKNNKSFYNLTNKAEEPPSWKGKKHTESSKEKISKANSGASNGMYGRKHSEEHKKYLSKINTGEKNNMYGKKGKDAPSSVSVYCGYLNKKFDTLKDCAAELGIDSSSLTKMLNGQRRNKYNLKRL